MREIDLQTERRDAARRHHRRGARRARRRDGRRVRGAGLRAAHDGRRHDQRARRPGASRDDLEAALERIVGDGVALAAHRGRRRAERAVARPRVARSARRCSSRSRTASSRSARWQGIFFCEFDGPRDRKVYVRPIAAARAGHGYPGPVAAPVPKDQELELHDRLARLRRERRRAPERLRRLRPARAARRHGARARHEGEAQSRRGDWRSRSLEPGAPRVEAPCAHFPDVRRLPFPGSRLRGAARGEGGAGARRARADRRHRRLRARAGRPGRRRVFGYRNKLEYSFTPDARRARRSASTRAGRWDEVLDIERCWLTTDLGNAIRDAVREWAREEGLARVRPGGAATGYLRHLVVREGRNTGQALVMLVTAPGELPGAERFVEALQRASPRCARSTGRSTTRPAEVTNLPSKLLWGEEAIEEEMLGLRFRVRPNAFLQTNTAMCERLYRARGRVRRARPGARPSTTSTAGSARSASRWRATR